MAKREYIASLAAIETHIDPRLQIDAGKVVQLEFDAKDANRQDQYLIIRLPKSEAEALLEKIQRALDYLRQ